jgi:hypothetical protein
LGVLRSRRRTASLHDRRFLTDDPCPIDFHPIAIEAMGAVGAKGKRSLQTLARRAFPLRAKQDGEWDVHGHTSMYTRRRLRAVVQVGLAKGNELMFAKFRQPKCQEMCRIEGWVFRGGNGSFVRVNELIIDLARPFRTAPQIQLQTQPQQRIVLPNALIP